MTPYTHVYLSICLLIFYQLSIPGQGQIGIPIVNFPKITRNEMVIIVITGNNASNTTVAVFILFCLDSMSTLPFLLFELSP